MSFKLQVKFMLFVGFISLFSACTSSQANALTFGCKKAQAQAYEYGTNAKNSMIDEFTAENAKSWTSAYESYVLTSQFAIKWNKIVTKSPKCFGSDYIAKLNKYLDGYLQTKSMCQKYGVTICKTWPSKSPKVTPRNYTLNDICPTNTSAQEYQSCIEGQGRDTAGSYVD